MKDGEGSDLGQNNRQRKNPTGTRPGQYYNSEDHRMSRQTVCDQCGRPQSEGESWWALTKFSAVTPQDNLSFDLCSDSCLAAWSATRHAES